METIDRNKAMKNPKFYDACMDAFYSSQEFEDALEDFLDANWDGLIDEYWNESQDDNIDNDTILCYTCGCIIDGNGEIWGEGDTEMMEGSKFYCSAKCKQAEEGPESV